MLEEALDGPAARLDDLRQLQVLFHRQAGDDAAVLRHQADADARRLEGLHLVQRLVVEPDLAMTQVRLSKARNAAQRRSLAGAVAPEQGDALPLVHRSEEHTSAPQSLMRISYAVSCSKQ